MQHIQAIPLRPAARVRRINLGRTLALIVTLGLALLITLGLAVGAALSAGAAPQFEQPIILYAQHMLVIHYGLSPCPFIPDLPQHDCLRIGSEPRVFSVDYLTPQGVHSLVWFRLPAR
jgi:hypothetical protein